MKGSQHWRPDGRWKRPKAEQNENNNNTEPSNSYPPFFPYAFLPFADVHPHPMSSPKPPSRLTNWRDYLPNRDIKAVLSARVRALRPSEHGMGGGDTLHNLSQWAGQKIRRNVPDSPTVNQVDLFPGWATRRPLISARKEYQRKFFRCALSVGASLAACRSIRPPCAYLWNCHLSTYT